MPPYTPSSSAPASRNWFADKYYRFHDGHERVKNAVHSYWRKNSILSPRGTFGKVFMSCFYFSLPVAFAYVVVNRLADGAESNALERLGGGDGEATEALSASQKVGAGGWGGGVNLATSDLQTQEMNRINLERYLKKQRKLKERKEREAAAAAAACCGKMNQ